MQGKLFELFAECTKFGEDAVKFLNEKEFNPNDILTIQVSGDGYVRVAILGSKERYEVTKMGFEDEYTCKFTPYSEVTGGEIEEEEVFENGTEV